MWYMPQETHIFCEMICMFACKSLITSCEASMMNWGPMAFQHMCTSTNRIWKQPRNRSNLSPAYGRLGLQDRCGIFWSLLWQLRRRIHRSLCRFQRGLSRSLCWGGEPICDCHNHMSSPGGFDRKSGWPWQQSQQKAHKASLKSPCLQHKPIDFLFK